MVKPNFGSKGMPDETAPQAALEDPAFGADPTFAPAPAEPAQIEPRLPNFVGAPEDTSAINDDDLLTPEEAQARLAQILQMDPAELGAPYQHDENLAEKLEDQYLNDLGQELLEKIQADLESRKPWMQRFKRGLQVLGLEDFVWGQGAAPFEGASTVVLPLLGEAIMQSQARFMEEIYPSEGPVKTRVMGKETPEKRDSADRVASHMNYQLTDEDEIYFMESQKLALYLPIFGSAYRKAYHDYVQDRNVLRFITGEDMILPYGARNLHDSPRKTHRFKMDRDEYTASVACGAWREVNLSDPPPAAPDEVKQQLDKLDDKTPVEEDKDQQWTFYQTDLKLDIPGYQDKDAEGKPTGIALPYTVDIEEESGKVLAIRRCWKEVEPLKKMRTRYTEYWYFPGLGSYGTGLIHWIGSVAEAGTDALRALLDSATFANLQGGFKAKDSGTKAGELAIKPGVWQDVDMTSDELAKAFHTPPVREPSKALHELLGLLIDVGRRFGSITDMMVGDEQSKGAPVGTTIALIEQGSKVYSGVHKRAHFSCGIELKMLFDLNAEFIPDEGYPYQVEGDDLAVYRSDYDTQMVKVRPVSDPNIFSQTQRIALAQTRYQIWKDNPSYFRGIEVLRNLFKAFKDPEIDTTLIDPDDVPVMDPVTENVAMCTGRPVRAKDGENHDAHLIVHMGFAQHPQFGGLPQAQQLLGPAMMAHLAEHVALKYAETQRRLGVPVPKLNLSVPAGTSIAGDEAEPQQADAVGMMAAQVIGQFMQQSGLVTTPPGEEPGAGGAEQDSPEQKAADLEKTKAQTWQAITAGLANMAKAGLSLEQAMMAEHMIEAGQMPAPGSAPAGAPPSGAFGAAPKMPGAPPSGRGGGGPAMARPGAAPKAHSGPAPGMGPALHDENIDGAPAHNEAQPNQ